MINISHELHRMWWLGRPMPSFQELMTQQLHMFGKLVNFEEPLPGRRALLYPDTPTVIRVTCYSIIQTYKYGTSAYQCDQVCGRIEESDQPSQSQRGA